MMDRLSLCWKINWYRQSELEGALLLGRMVRSVADSELVGSLTRHCVDEANHSLLWMETLKALGLPAIRIYRSYQSFYLEPPGLESEGGSGGASGGGMPSSLGEVLAFTHIFELRVDQHFRQELSDARTPPAMRETLEILNRDEQRHLDWVRRALHTQPGSEAMLDRYRRIDERVYAYLSPYLDRLQDLKGLGEPPTTPLLP